jgi:hypothetical protein
MRGALLIAAAVILGAGLLAKSFDSGGPLNTGSTTSPTTHTTVPPSSTTTTIAQPHDPSQVKVLVLNGSGKSGVAGTTSDTLKAANYATLEPGNAAQTATSVVYFVPGYDADAQAVATKLGLPASSVQPLPNPSPVDSKDANVVVVIGADAPAAGGGTTTTAAN